MFSLCLASSRTSCLVRCSGTFDLGLSERYNVVPRAICIPAPLCPQLSPTYPSTNTHRPPPTPAHARSSNDLRPSASGVGGGGARGGGGAETPDDGCPTKVSTPGQPLLLNGKLLVYPSAYECHRCAFTSLSSFFFFLCHSPPPKTPILNPLPSPSPGLNTGFKNFDTSHSYKKCWDCYARPYARSLHPLRS